MGKAFNPLFYLYWHLTAVSRDRQCRPLLGTQADSNPHTFI